MVYLGNFKTFIIYLKTKYDDSVLSIVCHPKCGAVAMSLQIMRIENYGVTAQQLDL